MNIAEKPEKTGFQLKADFFPMMVLKISHTDIDIIAKQIENTVIKAPKQFIHAPIIIDVDQLDQTATATIDFKKLCAALRAYQIIPVGVRGLSNQHHDTALGLGLAILKTTKSLASQTAVKQAVGPQENPYHTQLITKPVRSGTRVYAKNGDLIILSAVNVGGECIADGHIHVYGPLRGRALAGATGNTNARIFCKVLDAELISIAGHYLVKEDIHLPAGNYPMIQIYLENEKIIIEEA